MVGRDVCIPACVKMVDGKFCQMVLPEWSLKDESLLHQSLEPGLGNGSNRKLLFLMAAVFCLLTALWSDHSTLSGWMLKV